MKYYLFSSLVVVLLLSGCATSQVGQNSDVGGNNSNQQGQINNKIASKIDPCEIMTEAEAEAVLGEGYDLIKDENNAEYNLMDWQKICFYESTDDEDLSFGQIAIQDPGADRLPVPIKQNFDTTRSMFAEGADAYQIVDGIGTEAYRTEGLAGGLSVYDAQSDASFQLKFNVGMGNSPTADQISRQEALAKEIVEKLRAIY